VIARRLRCQARRAGRLRRWDARWPESEMEAKAPTMAWRGVAAKP
jgi:hypothetical protein